MNERLFHLYNLAKKPVFNPERFAAMIVADCVETVREVLRENDPDSTINYRDASEIQKRMKENFGLKEWY